ncbi:MAG: OmpA family protein [Woeseiaceae bacterium]|nr:OmpA family protein [Woeseiaceae bacterium]
MSTGRGAARKSGPRLVQSAFGTAVRSILVACVASSAMAGPAFASPPGAVITNQASLDFVNLAGQPATFASNSVSVTVAVTRSAANVEFTRVVPAGTGAYQETVGPSACLQGGSFVNLADPSILGGNVIDPALVQDASGATTMNIGETAFVRLVDTDQNLDFQATEYAVVTVSNLQTGDSETLQLTETGPDTGVFTGYIPLGGGVVTPGDCVLQGAPKTAINLSYTDPADGNDSAQASAQLDPVQRVFESRTGALVDGTTIELVDATTGLPATVYGNDGIARFPSTVVSGGTVTDSAGTSYVFGPGEYRFPVVPDGDFRLLVTPPPAYAAPSSEAIDDLQNLPGAPFALSAASFGATFTKSDGVSVAVDVPVDPQASSLFLQKRTLTAVAAPGDFVRYEIAVENSVGPGDANDVRIVDQLPPGVRFIAGSVRVNGAEVPDPVISTDLRTLEINVGTLPTGVRTTISYVVEIIGGKRNDKLINTATAFAAGGLLSNESAATVLLREDLFRSTGTIIGRVLDGDCSQETFGEDQGVAGIRVYLEDGRYAVTDAGGRFHFEGVEAGTHVAQLDTFTVPAYFDVIGCSATPGFAGNAESQFVKLARGALQRADFYLRRKEPPHGRIDIEMRNSGTNSTEQVAYNLTLTGVGNVEIDNISLMVLLPQGVTYAPGTLRINGQELGEPHLTGPAMTMTLDGQFGNWTRELSFIANIDDQVDGELVTKAVGTFDTPMASKQKTPLVETKMVREPAVLENEGYVLDLKFAVLSDQLSPQDKLQLDTLIEGWEGVADIQLSAVGHSDSQRISARNQHLFADNYVLSEARALAAASYIAGALDVKPGNIQVEGRGPDEPVADNGSAAGRQKNRRVEMVLSGIRPKQPSFLEVTQASSGTKETETIGAIPGMERKTRVADAIDNSVGMPSSQKVPGVDALQPGMAMLLPERGFAPAIPATKIAVQHEPGQTVEVTINDAPVNALTFAGVTANGTGTVAISLWEGVGLVDGKNEIRAVIRNADGSKAKGVRRTIHFTGGPIRAEFVEAQSVLVADGKTHPVIALRLFDRANKPARAGIVGKFRVDAPYRSAWDEEEDRRNKLVEIGDRSASYKVGADGVALLELAPTTQTGEVTVVLPFQNYREQEVRAWLKPAQREWILVGFAEGTAAHATLSDNMVAAEEAGFEDGYYDEGRVAFFAKGTVKGEYLLTLAYDSDRDRDSTRDRFDTVVDPNAYYTLYADTAEQRFEAASQRKIYVKLERDTFYALFGDFDTGLSVTDLARYERRFNGLKSEFRGRNVGYTMFAAETDQSFNRDELRGDGTSGLYQLSSAPIIANSEQVRIEVRDRFDSATVLSVQNQARFLDYTLDTLTGTLYFKRPVPSRDLDFNPVFIVVEYESVATGTDDVVAGGRGSLRFAKDAVEIGVSHVNDGSQGAEADLTGVDLRWQINDQTQLKAEIADSNSTVAGVDQSGSAHSVELEHSGEKVDVRAYVREVEDGFGLGQQSAADKGVRRLGVDARGKVGERWLIEGEAGWQQNLETEAIRNLARTRVRYEHNEFAATLGLAHAEDEYEDGLERTSQLVELGVAQRLLDGKLRLRANASTALNEDAENIDYPQSLVVGADYRLVDGVDLVAEYEDAEGAGIETSTARVGVRATPWNRAQINSFVTNEQSEFGPRLFANVGLIQGFQLNERWAIDVGVDHAETIRDPSERRFDNDRELTSGTLTDDFTAAFAGAMYTSDLWSANSRLEVRNSDTEDRTTLLVGWYRQPTLGHGLSAGLTLFSADAVTGNELAQANLRFGWAYRKADSQWSFLDRIDLLYDRALASGAEQKSWRLINNFSANRRISAATSLSLQYAFKYVRSDFDGDGFTGYTDLVGVDFRRGLNDRWDIGAGASVLHSWNSKVIDYSAGIDVGYNLGSNIWLSLGYNFAGFDDDDFAQARYTAAGPFLRFSIKADQHLLRRIAGQ